MTETGTPARRRSDALRNESVVLQAAAEVFVDSGVQAPVRNIAARAGVGLGTIYRHFPTRADLIVAVYRHQVEACAAAGPRLSAEQPSAFEALRRWIDLFVDFLVTKHGLAAVIRADDPSFAGLHDHFIDRLVPVLAQLLAAASEELRDDVDAFALMFAVGNLCAGDGRNPRYDARRMVDLLVHGLRKDPA